MKYSITPRLGFRIYHKKDGWTYFGSFILLFSLSIFLCFFLEFYILKFKIENYYIYDFSYLKLLFFKVLRNSFLTTLILVIGIMFIIDFIGEAIRFINWRKR